MKQGGYVEPMFTTTGLEGTDTDNFYPSCPREFSAEKGMSNKYVIHLPPVFPNMISGELEIKFRRREDTCFMIPYQTHRHQNRSKVFNNFRFLIR